MTGAIADARRGLSEILAALPGLRVLDHPPASISETPAAVVLFESRDAALTLGGTSFAGRMKVVLAVASASAGEAYRSLEEYTEPSGANSVQAAVDADTTWGGAVDDGRLVSIDNVGARRLWGGVYTAADFHFRFIKRLPTQSPLS